MPRELKTRIDDGVLTAKRLNFNIKQDVAEHQQSIKSTLLVFLMLAILFVYFPLSKGELKDLDREAGEIHAPVLIHQNSVLSADYSLIVTAPVVDSPSADLGKNGCSVIPSLQLANDTHAITAPLPAKSVLAIAERVDAPGSPDILPLAIPNDMPASLCPSPSPTSNVSYGAAQDGTRETGYFSLRRDIAWNSHFDTGEMELSVSSTANCKERSGHGKQLDGHNCLQIN
jgi:hypothetical protein